MFKDEVTIVTAIREFFNDRIISIDEFKALSYEDKVELREMLIAEGYNVKPINVAPPQES